MVENIFSKFNGRSEMSRITLIDCGSISCDATVTCRLRSGDEAWVDASEARVEVLVERSGTSFRGGLTDRAVWVVEVAMDRTVVGLAVQTVCRLIVLHSMFSSRRPLPIHSFCVPFDRTVTRVSYILPPTFNDFTHHSRFWRH